MGSAELRIGRSFDRESGRTYYVAAFDHGPSLKVPPECRRALEVVGKVVSGEPAGVLLSPGLLARASRLFAFRGTPLPMMRSDFVDIGAAMRRG